MCVRALRGTDTRCDVMCIRALRGTDTGRDVMLVRALRGTAHVSILSDNRGMSETDNTPAHVTTQYCKLTQDWPLDSQSQVLIQSHIIRTVNS